MLESRLRVPKVLGLQRDRLDLLLSGVRRHRVTNLVAPAGSGKTTALAHYAAELTRTGTAAVAWYGMDTHDGGHLTLLNDLRQAVTAASGHGTGDTWGSSHEAVASLETVSGQLIIIIDDAHLITAGPSSTALAELLSLLPENVSFVISSRMATPIDMTTLRIEGLVLDLDADDLRFRTWEAERLLIETFGLLLQPDDVARLTRQVGGWAAGFQLYRLAAQELSPPHQRRLARSTSTHSMLAQRYLAQNLLNALRPRDKQFLLHTSVLGVVSPATANDLLERSDSYEILEQLAAPGAFITNLGDRTYRYHEVLQSHLEAELAEVLPADELQAHYLRAAELLETRGYTSESVRCYVRAGHRAGIDRLLQDLQSEDGLHSSLRLAAAISNDAELSADPWVLLLRARADVVAGKFRQADENYRLAEERFATLPTAETCRRERQELAGFVDPTERQSATWVGTFRHGLQRDPVRAADSLAQTGSPEAGVAGAFLLFLAGHYVESSRRFESALLLDDPPDWLIDVARLGRQLTRLITDVGEPDATHTLIERLMAKLDTTWIGRIALPIAAAAIGSVHGDEAVTAAERCDADGDAWGAALGFIFAGVSAHDTQVANRCYQRAAEVSGHLRSDLLNTWAHGGLALDPDARPEHRNEALRLTRRAGLERSPIEAFVELNRLRRESPPSGMAPETVARPQPSAPAPSVPEGPVSPAHTTRCFGKFEVSSTSDAVDQLRPQARAVLQRLALDCGTPVSFDTLIDDLWGGDAQRRSHRSLQVAVSSIRGALVADEAGRTVERVDVGYRLSEPEGGSSDIAEFRALVATGASSGTDPHQLIAAAERVLELVAMGLLPEAGLADWAITARERVELAAARLTRHAAAAALNNDDPRHAIDLAERGIELDEFDDELWRIAIDAHERCGAAAAASRLRSKYGELVESLESH